MHSSLKISAVLLTLSLVVAAVVASGQSTRAAAGTSPKNPIQPDRNEEREHLIGDQPQLRVSASYLNRPWAAIGFTDFYILVSPTGTVRITGGSDHSLFGAPEEVITRSMSLVESLHFKPFLRDGAPVWAQIDQQILILPPELKPQKHIPFPNLTTDSKGRMGLIITLERKDCPDPDCSGYKLEIQGDGHIDYLGGWFQAVQGRHVGTLPQVAVDQILDLFRQADFYSLDDKYLGRDKYLPFNIISVSVEGKTKQLTEQDGLRTGMPYSVTRIEESIDKAADSGRWTEGDENTAASLAAEHFDFKSTDAAAMLRRIAGFGNTQAVLDLLAAGVDPIGAALESGSESIPQRRRIEAPALFNAAEKQNLPMLRALLAAGAGADTNALNYSLLAAAGTGNIEAYHLLLNHGGNPGFVEEDGETMLMLAAASGVPALVREALQSAPSVNAQTTTGITALFESLAPLQDGDDRVQIVKMLLDAGADPNLGDKFGGFPLLDAVSNPRVTRELVRFGANVNAVDKESGDTALMRATDPETAKSLLDAGANLAVKNKNGQTALDIARQSGNLEVVKLLQAFKPKQPNK